MALEEEVRCPYCKKKGMQKFEKGTWLLEKEYYEGKAPLPHFCCSNCRRVWSVADLTGPEMRWFELDII